MNKGRINAVPWAQGMRVKFGMVVIDDNGYYQSTNAKSTKPSENESDWLYLGEVDKFGSLASLDASNLTEPSDIAQWQNKLGIQDLNPDDFLEKVDYTNNDGKILASMLEKLALFDSIKASENTIRDFVSNHQNYEFEKNDMIAVPRGTNPESYSLYLYTGDDKELEKNYLPTGILDTPTLQQVTDSGNTTTNSINFQGETNLAGNLGFNKNSYSHFWGNYSNPDEAIYNISIGYNVLNKVTTSRSTIGIGHYTLQELTTGSNNIAIGISAGQNLTTGGYNTFVGWASGAYSTTGNCNTFIGDEAGNKNTTGYKNTFLGTAAGYGNTNGNLNTIIGYKSNQSAMGDRNVILGCFSGQGVSGSNNVIIGVGAGINDGAISNKLIIHGNHTLSGYTNTSEGSYGSFQQGQLSMALLTGDFVQRWIRIGGRLEVSNIPDDVGYTHLITYNPQSGATAKTEKTSLGYIPISGTEVGKEVTGDIVLDNEDENRVLKGKVGGSLFGVASDGQVFINKDASTGENTGSDVNIKGIKIIGEGTQGIRADDIYQLRNDDEFVQKAHINHITGVRSSFKELTESSGGLNNHTADLIAINHNYTANILITHEAEFNRRSNNGNYIVRMPIDDKIIEIDESTTSCGIYYKDGTFVFFGYYYGGNTATLKGSGRNYMVCEKDKNVDSFLADKFIIIVEI